MSTTILAALIASTVTIHVSETSDLASDEAKSIVSELSAALTSRLDEAPVLDSDWSKCAPSAQNAEAVARRTGATEVVFLELYDAPSRIRVVASRIASEGSAPLVAETDTPRGLSHPELVKIAERLFPTMRSSSELSMSTSVSSREAPSRLGPVTVLVAGGVALGAGLWFGAKSVSARDELAGGGVPTDRIRPLVDEANGNALLGNVLFTTAGALAVGALVWLAMIESGPGAE
ncbi:MAG: hypothetical protein HY791_23525 [Deltaproteobacteria bacterium]|nr:hypothetical protein [Deltaproteobacteria bacterium]